MTTKEMEPFTPSPDDAELNGDLTLVAEIIDTMLPGKGKEVVVQIGARFAGTYVYFPQPQNLFRTVRNQWIVAQYDAGFRVPVIARAVSMSEKQVWHILGKEPGEDKQMRLFG